MQRTGWWRWFGAGLAAVALAGLLSAACGDDVGGATATGTASATGTGSGLTPPANVGKGDKASLTGAGATFPQPIYQAWFSDYNGKVASGVQTNYQGVGSGGGINQFTAGTVDFGASDVGMTDEQIVKAPDVQLLPTVIGAVVLTYNVEGLKAPLKLDGPTVANIYLGNIKKWNDPAITALNPGVSLPDKEIQVAFRSDSSGTSGVFTEYLSKVSAEWKTKVGSATAPNWPVGQGGQGNPGVAGLVKNTPNAIGYVELTYALQNKLAFADMKNKAGAFVTPSTESASAAAEGATPPADYRLSITDAAGEGAYPISSFTYILLYKSTGRCSQQTPLVDLLWWAYHDTGAQQTVKDLNYATLPAPLLERIDTTLRALKCDDGASASLKGG